MVQKYTRWVFRLEQTKLRQLWLLYYQILLSVEKESGKKPPLGEPQRSFPISLFPHLRIFWQEGVVSSQVQRALLAVSYIQCMWPIKPQVPVIGNVLLGESTSDPSLSLVLLVPYFMQTSLTVLNVMSSSRRCCYLKVESGGWKSKVNMQLLLLACLYNIT